MKKNIVILGISAFYHDSAAALIVNGTVVAAVQEERFTRIKHDDSFPIESIRWIIDSLNVDPVDIDHVVFYEKPFVRFERLLETYFAYAPIGFTSFRHSIPRWLKEKLFQKSKILKSLNDISKSVVWHDKLLFSDHHLSHAASAFYPSPFKEAAILTVDGVGEWATTTISLGRENSIEVQSELHFPHSIGLLYSTITSFLGFKVNSGEYKVMGLAPYGSPIYTNIILENLIDLKEDGSYRLNMSFFDFATDVSMASKKMTSLFCIEPRKPEDILTQDHKNIAASLQQATQIILMKICQHIAKTTKMKNLCLAGGVALNCVANEQIRKSGLFESVWIQPAAGDAGGAIGAALAVYYDLLAQPREIKTSYNTYLGPQFSQQEIKMQLEHVKAVYDFMSINDLLEEVPKLLEQGKIVGWMQGQAEFGPRALGNRSILADPRVHDLQSSLNLKIKFRESFRPFAPSILSEHASDYFEITGPSTYMGFIAIANSGIKEQTPAVVHVDNTARLQTVTKQHNPTFHKLLANFYEISGCPMLVNTSFNVRGEPMVLSPEDAFNCFMGTDIDVLVIGNYILHKKMQNKLRSQSHASQFAPD